jgi:hypothetical protein
VLEQYGFASERDDPIPQGFRVTHRDVEELEITMYLSEDLRVMVDDGLSALTFRFDDEELGFALLGAAHDQLGFLTGGDDG